MVVTTVGCRAPFVVVFLTLVVQVLSQKNPTILQDSRDLPTPEGYFGFLYRTEDGIAHGARGEPNGQVHGRFTYTDPTGLKVNFNYNAGSRATPGYKYDDQVATSAPAAAAPAPVQEYEQPSPSRQTLARENQYYNQPRQSAPRSQYYDQPRQSPARNAQPDYYDQPRNPRPQPSSRYNDINY